MAFAWLSTVMMRNPVLIGLVALAPQLPWVFLALPVGVWTDRLDHRRIIVLTNFGMATASLAVMARALWAVPGVASILALAGIAFVFSSVEVLRDNAAQTILPDVVEPVLPEAANAGWQSIENLAAQLVGPQLAGVMIAVGIALPFGFYAAMLTGAGPLLVWVRGRACQRAAVQGFWPALKDGLRWLWGNAALRNLWLVPGAYNFLSEVIRGIMVPFAQDSLHLNAVGLGVLLSGLALGRRVGGAVVSGSDWGTARPFAVHSGFSFLTAVLVLTNAPWNWAGFDR